MTWLLLHDARICAFPHQFRTQTVPESMKPSARNPQPFADRVQDVTAHVTTGNRLPFRIGEQQSRWIGSPARP
jgi:hypothetical protein